MAREPKDRVNITLRIPEGLRACLEDAASAEDRSLNAEISSRLERSFDEERTLAAILGDDRIAAFVLTIAAGLRTFRGLLGDGPWRSDPEVSKVVRASVNAVTAGFTAPQPDPASQAASIPADPLRQLELKGMPKERVAELRAELAKLMKPQG